MKDMKLVPTLDWEAEKKSVGVRTDGSYKVAPKYRAIIRNDSNEVLSIVKKNYNLLSNAEFMQLVNEIRVITNFDLQGFQAVKGGGVVLGYLKNSEPDLKIGGLAFEDYLVFGNSFTRETSLFVGSSSIVISCMNAFGRIHQGIKIPHFSTMDEKIKELKRYFVNYFEAKKDLYNAMEGFTKIKIDAEIIEQAINYVFELEKFEKPDKEISKQRFAKVVDCRESILQEVERIGDNGWGLFNGMTHFTSHKLASSKTKEETIGNLYGMKNYFNQRAFQFISELV